MSDLDRFLNRQNIARYRQLLDTATDETQRLQILKLLAEEEIKFKQELRAQMK